MNARKILKRKKLRRMLMSPKKKSSIKNTSNFKRIKPGKIFAFHFLLAWTENGHLFSYLNSLNFGTGSSLLDISFTTNLNVYIILHLTYLIGIFFVALEVICRMARVPCKNSKKWLSYGDFHANRSNGSFLAFLGPPRPA